MAVDGMQPWDVRVEGTLLSSYAFAVEMTESMTQIPARNLVGVSGPRMDGLVPIPGRYSDPPQFKLSMWISDRTAAGARAANPELQFQRNIEAVVAAFISQSATLTVERCMPDGTIRVAECRVAGSVSPTFPKAGDSRVAKVEVVLDIPGIFWKDKSGPFTQEYTTFGSEVDLGFVDPSTAPITDAVYKVTGPITNPKIANPYGGFVQYTGSLAAGQVWTVDVSAFTSKVGSSSVLFNTTYFHNSGYLFEVWPPYHVTVTGTGTSSGSKWSVTTDKKFF